MQTGVTWISLSSKGVWEGMFSSGFTVLLDKTRVLLPNMGVYWFPRAAITEHHKVGG